MTTILDNQIERWWNLDPDAYPGSYETKETFEKRAIALERLREIINADASSAALQAYAQWEQSYVSECGEHEDGWWCWNDTRAAFLAGWQINAPQSQHRSTNCWCAQFTSSERERVHVIQDEN